MTKREFEELVLDVSDNLFGLAYSILKQRDEAQDAVQEVIFRLWKNRKSLDRSKNLRSFCMRMVKNYCIDITRRQKHFENYVEDEKCYQYEKPVHEKRDLIEKIQVELIRLSDQQRLAIELKDFQGYSYEEISDMLEMPVNTIRVNVSRGRKKLFEIFKEELQYEYRK